MDRIVEFLEVNMEDANLVEQFRDALLIAAESVRVTDELTLRQVLEQCSLSVTTGETFPGAEVAQVMVLEVVVPIGLGIGAIELREYLHRSIYAKIARALGVHISPPTVEDPTDDDLT